jgi:hypothetical protein
VPVGATKQLRRHGFDELYEQEATLRKRSILTQSRLRWASWSMAFSIGFFAASSAFAQQPAGNAPPQKFTNLQVFPQDIPRADLIKQMRQFTVDLGVSCTFCHEENAQTHRPDFPADTKPEKKTARVMIAMTETINTKYLATLPVGDAKASCYTCHRGHSEPEAQPPAPPEPARGAPGGAPAAPPQP